MKKLAAEKNVVIKPFNVIYHLIDDMKREISNKLPLVQEEDVIGISNSIKIKKYYCLVVEFQLHLQKNVIFFSLFCHLYFDTSATNSIFI